MPPEMVEHKGHNWRADTWAVGILLYEMLHGYKPFEDVDDDQVKKAICNDELKWADQTFSDIEYSDEL